MNQQLSDNTENQISMESTVNAAPACRLRSINTFSLDRIYNTAEAAMQDDIFNLLMLILLLENGGSAENINQLVIMFLLMQGKDGNNSTPCSRSDGYTF